MASMTTCPDGRPHRRIIEGRPPNHRGVCKRCGDVQLYARTLEEVHMERARFRRKKKQPVSGIGGTA